MLATRRWPLLVVGFVTFASVTSLGQNQDKPKVSAAAGTSDGSPNPYTSAEDVREGGLVLDSWCAFCHGRPGRGGRGPDLVRGILRHGTSDQSLFKNIRDGIPGTQMTGVTDIDDKSVWQIVASIRSRRQPEQLPPGDKAAGQALFIKHNCGTCHWNGREGDRRGPDLSSSFVPVGYIRESLSDPDANLRDEPNFEHEKYQQISVTTTRGRPFLGRWLNDNGEFFLFIDQEDKLHAFRKDEIEEISKPRRSLMPSFKDLLSDQDVHHLIVYLFSIRPAPKEEESK